MNNKTVIFSNTFWAKTILSIASLSLILSPLGSVSAYYNQPDVSTQNATNISNTAATLNGSIYSNGLSTRAWFEYGTNNNLDSITSKTSYGSNSNNFSKDISDLDSNTTYYFRAVAQNSDGTSYGNIFSFTTGGYNYNNNNCYNNNYNCNYQYNNNNNQYYYNGYGQNYYNQNGSTNLNALTTGATDVTYTSANLNALIQNGSGAPANAWFEWGTSNSLGYATPTVSVDSLPNVNHVNTLSGLLPNTTYYFRAVVENSYWRNNGTILSFTTGGTTQTNTVIYQQQAPTTTTNTVTPAPTQNTNQSNNNGYNYNNASNLGGATILGGNSFLPQNIFGWLILVILFLILLLLVKNLYTPRATRHDTHENHH